MAIDIDQSHYNTGTATVAGTVVTGQGTTWLGAVRPGDLFGTHKGSGVRILSVNSNTSLTLAYAVTGLNQTAAIYEIQRTPYDVGYLKAIEDMIRLYGDGNLPSLAGLNGTGGDLGVMLTGAGTAGTFGLTAAMRQLADDPDFATMRATLGADNAGNLVAGLLGNDRLPDRLQQNSGFIPGGNYNTATKAGFYSGAGGSAISGPPGSGAYGPLIVGNRSGGAVITQLAMYGTASVRNEFYMRSSGDAGVTWSAWISILPIYGTNANGWYVRFPDGTQICGRDGSVTLALNNAYGPLFWGDIPLTFPIAFSVAPIPYGNVKAPGGVNWASVQPPSTSGFTLRAMDAYNVAAATINYSYGAIGRWLP